ncbi:hypothetical protein vseg_018682 [Gypsophila vaccaria]
MDDDMIHSERHVWKFCRWVDNDVVDSEKYDDVVHSEPERRVWEHMTQGIMVVVPMMMLIWIAYCGYKLTTMRYTQKNSSLQDSYMAILFGVVTVIFGLIYFVIGVIVVAEMGSDLLASLRQDDMKISGNREKEQTTNKQIVVHTIAFVVTMFVLTCLTYYGYRLAVEARVDVIVDRLAFLIGVISMAFGFVYFIIGIGTLAQSAVQSADEKGDALLDRPSEVKLVTVLCDP